MRFWVWVLGTHIKSGYGSVYLQLQHWMGEVEIVGFLRARWPANNDNWWAPGSIWDPDSKYNVGSDKKDTWFLSLVSTHLHTHEHVFLSQKHRHKNNQNKIIKYFKSVVGFWSIFPMPFGEGSPWTWSCLHMWPFQREVAHSLALSLGWSEAEQGAVDPHLPWADW